MLPFQVLKEKSTYFPCLFPSLLCWVPGVHHVGISMRVHNVPGLVSWQPDTSSFICITTMTLKKYMTCQCDFGLHFFTAHMHTYIHSERDSNHSELTGKGGRRGIIYWVIFFLRGSVDPAALWLHAFYSCLCCIKACQISNRRLCGRSLENTEYTSMCPPWGQAGKPQRSTALRKYHHGVSQLSHPPIAKGIPSDRPPAQ